MFTVSSRHNIVIIVHSALKSPAPSLPLTADGEWETTSFCGSWVEGRTAGGSRNFLSYWQNPRFSFTLCDEPDVPSGVNVKISLHQSCPDTELLPIGFHVYKVRLGHFVPFINWALKGVFCFIFTIKHVCNFLIACASPQLQQTGRDVLNFSEWVRASILNWSIWF